MLFGMIKEVAGKHSQEQLEEFAAALTEGQIQFIVDRYMGYANAYNDKLFAQADTTHDALWRKFCQEWTAEATRWAQLEAGM